MNWKLPNQLTVARIALAVVFFVLLGLYRHGAPSGPGLLTAAFVVYLLAGVTDVLDGYLARRWEICSAFGRIVDPFVDKVLVVGAFAMLAGANFVARTPAAAGEALRPIELDLPYWLGGHMLSGVQAWMVVVVLAREFIVSALRGYSESCGRKFPATYAGKAKMFVQSVAICTVLVQLAYVHAVWAVWLKLVLVWLAVVITVLSGAVYVGRARHLLQSDEQPQPAS